MINRITARKVFDKAKLFADSFGLNEELDENSQIILVTLSCQLTIDATAFDEC